MAQDLRTSASFKSATVSPKSIKDGKDLERLEALLEMNIPQLVGPDNTRVDLPPAIYDVLLALVRMLMNGEEVSLIPEGLIMTTKEAADLLNVSRPHLIKLLDNGAIPSAPSVGSHRRVRAKDVMEYRESRDQKRRVSVKDMSKLRKAAGLYDD